jgi:hypothetical protein
MADLRVSLPVPNDQSHNMVQKESPFEYAKRAFNEMVHFQSCLLPTQRLFMTIPRQNQQ